MHVYAITNTANDKIYIGQHQDPEVGYNCTAGGTGGATRTGYKNSPEHIQNARLGLLGKPKSEEHRRHLSVAKIGVPCPAVAESNIRRRSEVPSKAALRNRRWRARVKESQCQI